MKLFKEKIIGEIVKYSHSTAKNNPNMIMDCFHKNINELKEEIQIIENEYKECSMVTLVENFTDTFIDITLPVFNMNYRYPYYTISEEYELSFEEFKNKCNYNRGEIKGVQFSIEDIESILKQHEDRNYKILHEKKSKLTPLQNKLSKLEIEYNYFTTKYMN